MMLVRTVRSAMRQITSPNTRRKLAFAVVEARRPTARWRPLPNALIIGAQRCGTSSLFKYLGAHPDCSSSIRKEIRFFTEFHDRGVDWYRSHFPVAVGPWSRSQVNFEATPDYLLDPRVPQRVADLLPDLRIIVLLRDPVARAYSHYWHNRRLGTETLSFDQALAREEERIGPALEAIVADPDIPTPKPLLRYSYVERGRYSAQLQRWARVVSRDRVLVLRSEGIFKDPDATFQEVLKFLELDEWRPPTYRNYSYDSSRPIPPSMPNDCRQRLEELLSEDLQRLPEALGALAVDLPDWSVGKA